MVTLARIMRWEGSPGDFDRPRSPEEIIAKLEQKVGPQGRAIFEEFLAKVARLQEAQRLEITGENDDGTEDLGGSEALGDRDQEGGSNGGND
jgi:hypothetical protein